MNKIAIFSVPRSGSTWLGQIFNSSPHVMFRFQPNFAYSFEQTLFENSSIEEIENFFKGLIETEDDFVTARKSISNKNNVIFDKFNPEFLVFKETHFLHVIENLLEKSDTKIIGLIRSPFSVINSWIKIPKEFNPEWDLKEEWFYAPSKNQNQKFNYFGYDKWKFGALLFLDLKKKFPNQFYLVNYDDLLEDTLSEISALFDFCEIPLTMQTKNFIENSRKKTDDDAYSVFKLKLNDTEWKNELPEYIIDSIKNDLDFIEINKQFNWTV